MTKDDDERMRVLPEVNKITADFLNMTNTIAGHNKTIVERHLYVRPFSEEVRKAINGLRKALDELDRMF